MIKIFTILFSILRFNIAYSQPQYVHLPSPDGRIAFTFQIENGLPVYSILFKGHHLVENSQMNLELEGIGKLTKATYRQKPVFKEANTSYKLIVGKASIVKEHYKQATIYLSDETNLNYKLDIEVRVFNDGVAFRYILPVQQAQNFFTLLEEQTQFRMGNPLIKALLLPSFTTSHEGLYTIASLSEIKEDTLIDMPALFQFSDKTFMAITEAALLDHAGMYLIKKNGTLYSELSPLPNQQGVKVRSTLPHNCPWRVLLIGDRLGSLIESNIITSLNSPSYFKDFSWIKPGTSTFPWWNGTVIPDTVVGGNNFETNKYYIDFCAANNIKYHTVVEFGGHEWYMNDGEGYQPGKKFDITKPVPGLDMKQICDYGKKKGVGIRVWTHWKALYPKLDTAFALFEKWGLSGMMVDFMDRDDQEMVNIQTEILQKAAKHRLHIQFHGAYKPTGLHRTYPNEFTREGAMNYEYDKWDKLVTPNADLNIVFTRMLAGPTDYHQGGFNALPVEKFVARDIRPYVMGTRCHMLAMYVVLENYLPMVCDYPDAYIDQPGFEVIKKIPGSWDETKVVTAGLDQYVSIARRKNDTWYLGTIGNNEGMELEINFNFLPIGKYEALIYSDADDANENANHLTKQTRSVDRNTVLKVNLAPGGGNLMIINKLKK